MDAPDAPADASIDALRRALTAELRDRKVRVDSLAAADAALGAGSADGNVDATLRRDARFRRPGRDKPPAWVERLVAFVDDAPVFRTRGGGADGGASGPGACTRETIGALERWVDASARGAGSVGANRGRSEEPPETNSSERSSLDGRRHGMPGLCAAVLGSTSPPSTRTTHTVNAPPTAPASSVDALVPAAIRSPVGPSDE